MIKATYFLLISLSFVSLSALAAVSQKLLNRPDQPTMAEAIWEMSQVSEQNASSLPARKSELNPEGTQHFVQMAEAAYPGLTFVFLGRDTAPLARAVDAYLIHRGEPNRVVNLPVSRNVFANLSETQIVEMLLQQGLRLHLTEDTKPFIFIDRTDFDQGRPKVSQVTELLSAIYKAFTKFQISPQLYLKKVNMIAVHEYEPNDGAPLVEASNEQAAKNFINSPKSEKMKNVLLTGSRKSYIIPSQALWIRVGKGLLDQESLEWHSTYAQVQSSKGIYQGVTDITKAAPFIELSSFAYEFKRRDVLQFMWDQWKHFQQDSWHQTHYDPYIKTILSKDGINLPTATRYIHDSSITDKERIKILKFVLDFGAASGKAQKSYGATLIENLFPELNSKTNPYFKALQSLQSEEAERVGVYNEIFILGELLRRQGNAANEELVDFSVQRLTQIMDRWVTLEGSELHKISATRLRTIAKLLDMPQAQDSLLDVLTEKIGASVFTKTGRRASANMGGIEEDVINDPKEKKIINYEKRMFPFVLLWIHGFAAGFGYTYGLSHEISIAFVSASLLTDGFVTYMDPKFFWNGLKNTYQKTILKSKQLVGIDTISAAPALAHYEKQRTRMMKACVISLEKARGQ